MSFSYEQNQESYFNEKDGLLSTIQNSRRIIQIMDQPIVGFSGWDNTSMITLATSVQENEKVRITPGNTNHMAVASQNHTISAVDDDALLTIVAHIKKQKARVLR